ncbi:MAG: RadC family protein [Flavobacteriales bacterium]
MKKNTEIPYIPIRDWAESERPREKLIERGSSALSNAELLAILINNGPQGISALDIARRLLEMAGNNLAVLARTDPRDMKRIHGIGPRKAAALVAALELGSRRRHAEAMENPVIDGSQSAYNIIEPALCDLRHEVFMALYLNRANRVIGQKIHSTGGIAGTIVDLRLLFKEALMLEASALVLGHNHPSGNKSPSRSDIVLTKKIKDAGALMEVRLLDHIIVTPKTNVYFSFTDEGLL